MCTRSIWIPSANAIHWLGAALSGALNIVRSVWATKSIVSSIGTNGIHSASPVLVVSTVMLAGTISSPVTDTVHRLRATLGDAINLAVLVRACNSVQVSLGGDFVGPAAFIRVSTRNMITGAI